MNTTESREELINSSDHLDNSDELQFKEDRPLTSVEKTYLLLAERGDCASVRRLIEEHGSTDELDINCVDPLNRSALIAAIENENIELIKILLEENVQVKDALLHAIKEEYVEAVELLLDWEEKHYKLGQPYSWEAMDHSSSSFTNDITPLILAAHKNNYEILKILLDRGATLPMPHDVRCGCDSCIFTSEQDSLRHSQSRINAYRALSSSSLIALSSKDPLLTAFELSWELRRLSRMETEFRTEYNDMRLQCQTFATTLLDHVRTSHELKVMLNYNPASMEWMEGEKDTLERLKLAIKYKQKMFVSHPNVQQLLGSMWYEGLPGFRRKGIVGQIFQVAKLGAMFPVYSFIYMFFPKSKMGLFMKKPFVKFICHSTSYAFFLMLLGLASQRAEFLVLEWFGTPWMKSILADWKHKERGAGPGFAELGVILYVISLIWCEIRALWSDGIIEYIADLWNIVDFITNMFYLMWLCLRMSSWYIVRREASLGKDPWYPREQWDPYDPMLLSEGAFAAGMIFSFLKLVHIFSVNPHLGPLQISLGRMIIDIIKFFFIYTLVLFAFGCGLNQLLWYYAELEKNKCYHLPSGLPDFDNNEKACGIWRRYANLFETSQSLFWASFGLVDLMTFELAGIKSFTRFWALLMFGSYSVINVIVLLNMLIAMMSNSYQIISERSDMEWKFARSRLWMSYFEEGDTVPPPFNIIPTTKSFLKLFSCNTDRKGIGSMMNKSREKAAKWHDHVMKLLVRRYVTTEQRTRDEYGISEDDVMEIRQDISTLRYELIDILHRNGMSTPNVTIQDTQIPGKKGRVMERRLLTNFHIGIVEGLRNEVINSAKQSTDVFSQLAKVLSKRVSSKKKKDWNTLVRKNTIVCDQIGSAREAKLKQIRRQSLRHHIISNVDLTAVDQDKLLEYNPKLSEVTPTARLAYAKFMKPKINKDYIIGQKEQDSDASEKPVTAKTEVVELHENKDMHITAKVCFKDENPASTSSPENNASASEQDESIAVQAGSEIFNGAEDNKNIITELSAIPEESSRPASVIDDYKSVASEPIDEPSSSTKNKESNLPVPTITVTSSPNGKSKVSGSVRTGWI